MPFMGNLKRNSLVTISVNAVGGPTATTLKKVVRIPQLPNFEILEIDVLTSVVGVPGHLTPTLGNNVIRVLLDVSVAPNGGTATVKVQQAEGPGGAVVNQEEIVFEDVTLVYDVVPA